MNYRQKGQEFPNGKGVYLVGSTYFNPYTHEEIYFIKVGKSNDINKRMKNYATHNPMLWKADYRVTEYSSSLESFCQFELSKIALQVADNTDEWFEVKREDYLNICEQGFKWFEQSEYAECMKKYGL